MSTSTGARCGTPSGYNRHRDHDEKPCSACAAARREYDQRRRSAPNQTQVSRLRAKAQHRALKRLKDMNPEIYAALYAEEKANAIEGGK